MTAQDKGTTVALVAHASKGWQRGSQWTVTVPETFLYGSGDTLAAARESVAEQALAALVAGSELPALVRDGDGSLWIFTPCRDGNRSIRVRPDGTVSGCVTVSGGSPAYSADMIVKHHEGATRIY